MILSLFLLVLPAVLLALGLFVFARRDDDSLERIWQRLMSPEARRLRQTVDERVLAQRTMLANTRSWARRARSAGDAAHAARIEREARALAERLQHGDLLLVRRMLSALRAPGRRRMKEGRLITARRVS